MKRNNLMPQYRFRNGFIPSKERNIVEDFFINKELSELPSYEDIFRYGVTEESLNIASAVARLKVSRLINVKYKSAIIINNFRDSISLFKETGIMLNVESPYEPNYVNAE